MSKGKVTYLMLTHIDNLKQIQKILEFVKQMRISGR